MDFSVLILHLRVISVYQSWCMILHRSCNKLYQADSGKLGDSDSSVFRASEEELDNDECLGQVPETSWAVPQVPSPPTASGLYWSRSSYSSSNYAAFVPNVSPSRMQNAPTSQFNGTILKRRRQF